MISETNLTRFRIYTEDVHPTDERLDAIGITPEVLIGSYFNGYTIDKTMGYWRGTLENAVVFEIIAPPTRKRSALKAAEEIRKRCGQKAVIVTAEPVTQYFITGD